MYKIIDYGDLICYYKKGISIAHREDGPAIIHLNGDKLWYIENECHRLDGPAV